jgi:hypothetical protein
MIVETDPFSPNVCCSAPPISFVGSCTTERPTPRLTSVRELTQDEPLRVAGAVMGLQNIHLSYYVRDRPQFDRITRARYSASARQFRSTS